MTEINGVTHVPRVVFYQSTVEGDEASHIALRDRGQLLCGEPTAFTTPLPGGAVCPACTTAMEHVSVVRGEYPRDTKAEEVPAP